MCLSTFSGEAKLTRSRGRAELQLHIQAQLHQIRPLIRRDANKHDSVLRGCSGKGCDRGVGFHVQPPEETLKARRV